MSKNAIARRKGRTRRRKAIRKRVFGTPERPRLSVFRSARHIYVQAIDDVTGVTLAAASTLDKDIRTEVAEKNPTEAAEVVGKALAAALQAKAVEKAVFDRGGYQYHGRIKALADGAREGGLSL